MKMEESENEKGPIRVQAVSSRSDTIMCVENFVVTKQGRKIIKCFFPERNNSNDPLKCKFEKLRKKSKNHLVINTESLCPHILLFSYLNEVVFSLLYCFSVSPQVGRGLLVSVFQSS